MLNILSEARLIIIIFLFNRFIKSSDDSITDYQNESKINNRVSEKTKELCLENKSLKSNLEMQKKDNLQKDNKILGIGPKNFRIKCKEKKYQISELTCSTHPHNTVLQLMSETGILGFMFYFTSYIFFIPLDG